MDNTACTAHATTILSNCACLYLSDNCKYMKLTTVMKHCAQKNLLLIIKNRSACVYKYISMLRRTMFVDTRTCISDNTCAFVAIRSKPR